MSSLSWTASFRQDLALWVRNENKPNRKSVREKVERKIQNECKKYGTPRVKSNLCEHELAMLNALDFPMYSADPLNFDEIMTYVADTRNEHTQEKWNRDFSSWIRWKKDNQNQGLPTDAALCRWVVAQCVEHRKLQLNNDQIGLLHACGFDFDADSLESVELSGDDGDDDDNDNDSIPQNGQKRPSSAISTDHPKKLRLSGAQQLSNHLANAASKMAPTPAITASINGGIHQNPSPPAVPQLHRKQSSTATEDLNRKLPAKEDFQAIGTRAAASTSTARSPSNDIIRESTAVSSTMNSTSSVFPSQPRLQPPNPSFPPMPQVHQNQPSTATEDHNPKPAAKEDFQAIGGTNAPASTNTTRSPTNGIHQVSTAATSTMNSTPSTFSSRARLQAPNPSFLAASQVLQNQSSAPSEGLYQPPAARENFPATFMTGTSALASTNTAGTQVSTTSMPPSSMIGLMPPWYCVQGMPTGPLQTNAAAMAIPWSHSLSSQISDETVNPYYALVNNYVEIFQVQSDWDCHMWKGHGCAMVGQVGLRCSACRMVAFFPTELGTQESGGLSVGKALDTLVELHLLPQQNYARSHGCTGLKEEVRQRLVEMKCQQQSKDAFYDCYAQAFVNLNIQEHPQFVGRLFLGSPPMTSASNGVGTSHANDEGSKMPTTTGIAASINGGMHQNPFLSAVPQVQENQSSTETEDLNRKLPAKEDFQAIGTEASASTNTARLPTNSIHQVSTAATSTMNSTPSVFPSQPRLQPPNDSQSVSLQANAAVTSIPSWRYSLSSLISDETVNPYYALVNNSVEMFQVRSDKEYYEGCERMMFGQIGFRCSHCGSFARFPQSLHGNSCGHGYSVMNALDAISEHHLIPSPNGRRRGCEKLKERDRQRLLQLKRQQKSSVMMQSEQPYVETLVNLGVEEDIHRQVGRGLFLGSPTPSTRGAFNDVPKHNLMIEGWSRPLYHASDHGSISPRQCFLRRQIELFEITSKQISELSVKFPTQVVIEQIGIRCIHCKEGFRFPRKLHTTVQAAEKMKSHFEQCTSMEDDVRKELKALAAISQEKHNTKEHYVKCLEDLRICEDTRENVTGLFRRNSK